MVVRFLTTLVVLLSHDPTCCHSLVVDDPQHYEESSSFLMEEHQLLHGVEDNNLAKTTTTTTREHITSPQNQENKQAQQSHRRRLGRRRDHEKDLEEEKQGVPYEVTVEEITSTTPDENQESENRHLASSSLERIVFYVMGDGPYDSRERDLLPIQLQILDKRAEFMVHVGDIQGRRDSCSSWYLRKPAEIMREFLTIPTFVIPGDNDWIECDDHEEQWDNWKETFLFFDQYWKNTHLTQDNVVEYQNGRAENFAFVHRKTLFMSVHVLTADMSSSLRDLWQEKDEDNADWISTQFNRHGSQVKTVVIFAHAYAEPNRYPNTYSRLQSVANEFKEKPILYIQGDTHKFIVDHKFPEADNILRLVVDRQGTWDPTEISIYPEDAVPFKFKRRIDRRYANSE
eukprot:CAMPEP_0195306108 /NCGR_PEP_ID=MMETSP0707-20130614/37031_1 /TAXON_ID=33640 /ORGANISM="Asterionellopsis glacialis, Strain CCMP134" /LENGTH=399 /DNA_ID=CAMNT_0040370317 /DNA_START=149 /DNA_END=1348 /DNA_ORIENTATION=+